MRIVSQNGMIDVPYEMAGLHCTDTIIRINMVSDTGRGSMIAEYSSSEKVKKAMEMLHEKYNSIEFMKLSGTPEIFGTMKKLLSEEEFDEVTGSTFRFPADNEIEVKE